MSNSLTPGVYRQEIFPQGASELPTGVPAVLGFAGRGPAGEPVSLSLWPQYVEKFGNEEEHSYLAYAVRGFFENGGRQCYVVRMDAQADLNTALNAALSALAPVEAVDLICAPDVAAYPDQALALNLQKRILEDCDRAITRLALLDALPNAGLSGILAQRQALPGRNGALYYPWIRVPGGPSATGGFIPPCGHVAGVIARCDAAAGVHKAPANEILIGVLDLQEDLTGTQTDQLHPAGINCLRALPGRGIRVWGARTLSDDPAQASLNVRRLFITLGRWIERNLAEAIFEPNGPLLWGRIERELGAYLDEWFRRGALKGSSPEQAFYVRCNGQTNPPHEREAGKVRTEVGLAPALPAEFIIVHIVHGAKGVQIVA